MCLCARNNLHFFPLPHTFRDHCIALQEEEKGEILLLVVVIETV
jgi:hypothetical protein